MSKKPSECIGPCYPKNTQVLHPITLFYVTDTQNPFCTIRPKPIPAGMGKRRFTAICEEATVNVEDMPDSMYSLPQLGLNPTNFLELYKIYSYEDSSTWYHNLVANEPEWATVRRVFDSVMAIYGIDKLPHIDDESSEVLSEILIRYWASKWSKRYEIGHDKILRLFTPDTMRNIVASYSKAALDRWKDIPSHMDLLQSTCAQILEEKKARI
jgi:hypothetical protein